MLRVGIHATSVSGDAILKTRVGIFATYTGRGVDLKTQVCIFATSGISGNFIPISYISGRFSKLPEVVPEIPMNLPAEYSHCRKSLPAAEKSLNSTMLVKIILFDVIDK